MKKFMKKTEGFTLVELIVVIAILGILAGVGTVGYSGYIKKANMAADESLVGEIKHALTLAYYSNMNGLQGAVVLSDDGAPDCGDNENIEAALVKTFGENWAAREDLRLKYDGWSDTFQKSNFYDDEAGLTELLGTVDTLTGALGNFLTKHSDKLNDGGAFASYVNAMAGEEGSVAAKADAAVFYIADEVGSLDSAALKNAVAALQKPENQGDADSALAALNRELGGSSLTSMASLYALAEGYATYFETNNCEVKTGDKTPREILDQFNTTIGETAGKDDATTAKVFGELFEKFNGMGQANFDALSAYLANPVAQDLSAFGEAMKTVSASKEGIIRNNNSALGDANYFKSDYVSDLLGAYAEGGIFVYVLENNGQIKVTSSIDADKQ